MTQQPNPRPIDLVLLRLVAEGVTDPFDLGVAQRLTVLRARYGADPAHGPQVREAWDAVLRAQVRADQAEDRAYLEGMLDGTVDLLSEEVFPRIEPMFATYPEGSEMFAMLERAATLFGDAVQEVAYRAMATWVIDDARRRAADE